LAVIIAKSATPRCLRTTVQLSSDTEEIHQTLTTKICIHQQQRCTCQPNTALIIAKNYKQLTHDMQLN